MEEVTAETGFLTEYRDAMSGRPADEVMTSIAARLRAADRLLVTAHVQPDGDALGSQVALAEGLRRLGKTVRILNGERPPEKYRGLLPDEVFDLVETPEQLTACGPADLCVLLDTSEPERAGRFQERFFAPGQERICLDHHVCRGPSAFDEHLVVTEAPATGNLVLALLDKLGVAPDRTMAQALWIAISTDTGWFRYPNATEWAFHDATRLTRQGLDLEALHARIYLDSPLRRTRILGQVLASIEEELGGQFIWALLRQEQISAENLNVEELSGMVDSLKTVQGAQVMAFIVELAPQQFKISLRARGDANVERVARKFGGGGHAKAAGCSFEGAADDLLSTLRGLVGAELA